MPTYTFRCMDCTQLWARDVPMAERNNQSCPGCDSTDVQRPVTGVQGLKIPGAHRTVRRHTPSLNGIDTSQLPTVGRDGRLYSADGKKVLAG